MIEIRFKDIDPDTGEITKDNLIAICEDPICAGWVLHALKTLDYAYPDPNREIYQLKK